MRERPLKLNEETGEVSNARDEALFVRSVREVKETYVGPPVETGICVQTTKKEVRVCTGWNGRRCTSRAVSRRTRRTECGPVPL